MNEPEPGLGAISALLIVIAISVWLGTQAQKAVQKGSFLKGYFLGNRGLGAWALALTATVQSGGTFMGYPSFVYTHGWIVALWIGQLHGGAIDRLWSVGEALCAIIAPQPAR